MEKKDNTPNNANIDSFETVKEIVALLDKKKAEDISLIKIGDISVIADYFLIVSGTSSTHVRALAGEVEEKTEEMGINLLRKEGMDSSNWIILDYGSLVIHIMQSQTREFYSLEHLWGDGVKVDINDIIE